MLNRIVPALAVAALIAPGSAADNGGDNNDHGNANGTVQGSPGLGGHESQSSAAGDKEQPTTTGSGTEMQQSDRNDRYGAEQHNRGTSSGAESLSQQDRNFIEKAASGGMYEVKSSQYLADQKIKDGREKDFAQEMIDDHSKANRELMKLAEKKGIDVPRTLKSDDQAKLDALKGLSGDELQKRYDQQQHQAHVAAIDLFRQEAQQGEDADVKAFAAKTLPMLEKHLQHLTKLEDTDRNLNLSK